MVRRARAARGAAWLWARLAEQVEEVVAGGVGGHVGDAKSRPLRLLVVPIYIYYI